jgi:hypothetical protein
MPHLVYDAQQTPLSDLRKEADALKQCFTNFSFQALVFSAAVLGILVQYADGRPKLKLSALLVVLLIFAVARIGIHKYATANRIYGFQLFAERLSGMTEANREGLTDATLDVGWEEAMRAWRIIQPTVFNALYTTGKMAWNRPTRRNKIAAKSNGAWWDVNSLIKKALPDIHDASRVEPKEWVGVAYYAGSYLSTMLFVLYTFICTSLGFVVFGLIELVNSQASAWRWASLPVAGTLIAYSAHNVIFIDRRRRLLESGLLSIHSCSIMWEAVVVAHNRALKELGGSHLNGYTGNLVKQISSLMDADQLENIHCWFKAKKELPIISASAAFVKKDGQVLV